MGRCPRRGGVWSPEGREGPPGPWAGARVHTLSLVFVFVMPVLAELHGGKHAPPGSVRGGRQNEVEGDRRREEDTQT